MEVCIRIFTSTSKRMEGILPSFKNVKVDMPTHSLDKEVGMTSTFKRMEGILPSFKNVDLGMSNPLF